MTAQVLADLLALSAQVFCVIALGALLPVLLRLDAAGVRYWYYRALLALCLLSWLQPRPADPASGVAGAITTSVAGVAAGAPAPPDGLPWIPMVGIVLMAGAAARAAWIAAGLVRLRRLRSAGLAAPPCREHGDLHDLIGAAAEVRYMAGLAQPVTFGIRRPIVLLPESLRTRPPQVVRAVLGHELIHVQRRDWAWLLAEEAVRAVFWFHPGVWWLVSRVQLAREEVVDELTVLATGTRRGYLEALAAFADETSLVPVAAFSRRRHLFRRMTLIAREGAMSSKRVVVSCAVMALVVAVAGWWAVDAFPLRAAAAQAPLESVGPLERQAKPVTPDNPIPRRAHAIAPQYPGDAQAVQASALVTLMITIDASGRVAEVRRVGVAPMDDPAAGSPANAAAMEAGLNALVGAAAEAVRQWQYDPPADAPVSVRVTFAFRPARAPQLVSHDGWSATAPAPFAIEARRARRGAAPPPPPPPPPPGTADEPPHWASDALRLRDGAQPRKLTNVNPVYPAEAKAARVQGMVIVEARIGADGRVTHARVIRSVPLLDQAALDAIMQWQYTPTLLNGVPVPVLMTITVQFTLSD